MLKHFCDRCGKEVEYSELINDAFGVKPKLYGDFYEETISLCPDCQKELMQWVGDAKEKSGITPPAIELVETMREKITTLTRIGNNITFTLEAITLDMEPPSPDLWVNIGRLMEEWDKAVQSRANKEAKA